MEFRIRNELIPLNLLVIALILVVVFFPSSILRIILGVPFLLFFPGYVLMVALYPRDGSVGTIERVAMSFGMSIIIVPLVGFILNYTSWGLALEPILYTTASFVLATSIVAWLKRKRLPEPSRFKIEFQLNRPGFGGNVWEKSLLAILVISIMGALGAAGYVLATPRMGQSFTEFYMLEQPVKTDEYPLSLSTGKTEKVVIAIANWDHHAVTYRIEVTIDNITNSDSGPILLEHEDEWRGEVLFTPDKTGQKQKVVFTLYHDGVPGEQLHLWVDVKD